MEYNYRKEVAKDVRWYIKQDVDLTEWINNREGLEEKLNNDLFIDDNVTGNASGSYTFSAHEAAEYLAHNWDLLDECMDNFGRFDAIDKGPEYCDVSIRCYVLGECISNVLDDLESDGAFEGSDDVEGE